LPDEPKIPKLSGVANPAALRLSSVEGFVLSRIDGKANESELAGLTGLNETQIRSALDKLVSLQVITFVSKEPAPVPGTSGDAAPSAEVADSAPAETLAKRVRAAIAAVSSEAPELTEDVDLPDALRKRILGTMMVLESLDYYELLALERDADKKAVKRSYFQLASNFHPDRYFRKRLGTFKAKMEAIFGRVTQAYDTLSSKEQRAEYDLYLADIDRTRAIEEILRSADEESRRAEQDAQRAASRTSYSEVPLEGGSARPGPASEGGTGAKPAGIPSGPPPAKTSGLYSIASPQGAPPTPAPPAGTSRPPIPHAPGSPVITDQARRDVLAMRLLGNRSRSMPPHAAGARTASARPSGDGGEGLKRRYEERVKQARKAQGEKYLLLAAEAEKKADLLGAATAYKVALASLEDQETDPAVVANAKAVIAKADASLMDTYLRQAQYEERSGHWIDAAKSWQRVARGRPNEARAHERAANALVLSKGDLHVAAELAKRAIQVEPGNADFKLTLATVFLEAGLGLNARRELEAAAQLSPRNANIQALLKRVNKAG
jgi:hypothetical protein